MVAIFDRLRHAARAFAANRELRGYGVQAVSGLYGRDMAYENPETVVTVATMRDMWRRDDQVRFCVTMRVQAALSSGGEVKPASDDDRDVEIAEFVTDAFAALHGGIRSFHRDFLRDKLVQGFAVYEPRIGDPITEGRWAGKQIYSDIMGRSGATIRFHLDTAGRVEKIEQDPMNGDPVVYWTTDELVYDAIDRMDADPYGSSPMRAAYRYWYIKQDAVSYWARYLERLGMPMPVGSYPYQDETVGGGMAHTANKKNRELILEAFKYLRREIALVKPEGWQVDFLQPNHYANVNLFRELWHECDRGISRSLGLPRLLGETGDGGGGAYALGKEHADQFEWILQDDLDALADVTNEQLIKPLVRYNFGSVDLPRWEFNRFRQEDMIARVTMLDLAMNKAPLKKDWYYEQIGAPMPAEEDETIGGGSGPQLTPNTGEKAEVPQVGRAAPMESGEEEGKMMAAGDDALDRAYNIDSIDDDEEAAAAMAGENLTVIFESARLDVGESEGKE